MCPELVLAGSLPRSISLHAAHFLLLCFFPVWFPQDFFSFSIHHRSQGCPASSCAPGMVGVSRNLQVEGLLDLACLAKESSAEISLNQPPTPAHRRLAGDFYSRGSQRVETCPPRRLLAMSGDILDYHCYGVLPASRGWQMCRTPHNVQGNPPCRKNFGLKQRQESCDWTFSCAGLVSQEFPYNSNSFSS